MDSSIFCKELEDLAWSILHENPGTAFDGWVDMLFEMYPCEIVDALGADEQKVMAQLSDMWHNIKYSDGATGLSMTYSEWAEYFSTTQPVEAYDLLSIQQYRTFDF